MLVIDLSNVNAAPDFRTIKRAGIQACFLKATEGLSYNDSKFASLRAGAEAAGLRVGAYHFARPDLHPSDARGEAEHFCSVVGPLKRRDLRPVLDFEVRGRHMQGSQDAEWAKEWNHVVRRLLGTWPLFYSYAALVAEMHFTRPVGAGLWLASYSRNDGKEHPYLVPPPWKKLVAHQFSSVGRVNGIGGHVDLSSAPKLRPLLARPLLGLL